MSTRIQILVQDGCSLTFASKTRTVIQLREIGVARLWSAMPAVMSSVGGRTWLWSMACRLAVMNELLRACTRATRTSHMVAAILVRLSHTVVIEFVMSVHHQRCILRRTNHNLSTHMLVGDSHPRAYTTGCAMATINPFALCTPYHTRHGHHYFTILFWPL